MVVDVRRGHSIVDIFNVSAWYGRRRRIPALRSAEVDRGRFRRMIVRRLVGVVGGQVEQARR